MKKHDKMSSLKRQSISRFLMSVIIIALLNVIAYFLFTRLDLTSEKRYSLSPATKSMLKNIDDIVYFKIYLDGEFPAGFKRLRNETREMLDEFRAYTDNIQYEFIDPSAIKNKNDRNNLYKQLMEKGLAPTNLQVKKEGGSSQQIIFPGALVTYRSKETPVQLLVSQVNTPPEAVLNTSVQSLEYNLANCIRKLSLKNKPGIAFIEGHGELNEYQTADITNALGEFFDVKRVTINEQLNSLTERDTRDSNNVKVSNKFEAIIFAKPDSFFSEKDKFIVDQFIMRGGKVLWLLDPVFASMDSLQVHNETMGIANNINLTDQLFKYGVRLNNELVMDVNAIPIPVRTGQMGNKPQFDFIPWYFFPLLSPGSNHPIVNGLNSVKSEFVSSLDTVGAQGIKKTILLRTSKYSRVVKAPAFISLDILKRDPDPKLYTGPPRNVALLLEGPFPSLYENRLTPEISESKQIAFVGGGTHSKMIVIADGDVIKNYFDVKKGVVYPLGWDRYTQETFGNKDLILNSIDYLCNNDGLISVRSRELKLRLLDMTRVDESSLMIQLTNTAGPVVLVLLFGLLQTWLRRRKYTRLTSKTNE